MTRWNWEARFLRCRALMTAAANANGVWCAKDIPPYVAPAQRTVALKEQPCPPNHCLALAYHAIQDDKAEQTYFSVRTDQLLAQLAWLRDNGYQVVSVAQILAAQKGGAALPEKAVLLNFDDSYQDFYTRVMPMLRAFNWPAVLAPVGTWLETPDDQAVQFGDIAASRAMFLNRDQLQRAALSPLVEIGVHTFNH